jgi:hypothetical protein
LQGDAVHKASAANAAAAPCRKRTAKRWTEHEQTEKVKNKVGGVACAPKTQKPPAASGCKGLCRIGFLLFLEALAEVRGRDRLVAVGTLLRNLNLCEIALVAAYVMEAFAYVTRYTCVFHENHLPFALVCPGISALMQPPSKKENLPCRLAFYCL